MNNKQEQSIAKSSIFSVFNERFVKPQSLGEDSKRQEFILNILLLGSLTLTSVAIIRVLIDISTYKEKYQGAGLSTVGIPLFIFLGLYILSRIRFFKIAAYIFIVLYYLLGTYTLYTWSIFLPQGLLVYVLVIVMSGILIGSWFAFLSTVIIAASLSFLQYAQFHHLIRPDLYWLNESPSLGDVIVFIFSLGVITLVSWLSNREIEKSLHRAQRSEVALKKERDMLEIKVEERTKELKRAQLEKMTQLYRFAEFGRLSSGLLHDLVSQISTVSLNLEELGTKDRSQLLDRAIEGTKRMERFIQSARRQIQKQHEITYFSLSEEIEQVIHVFSGKAKQGNITIHFRPSEEIKTYGNAVKFYQAVTNLLSNAIDAYDEVKDQANKPIEISLFRKEEKAHLAIVDQGIGIAEAELGKIFEPFYTTKNTEKGTGIGLSLTRDIVEKEFSGSIEARSKKGGKTVFEIEFPLKNPPTEGV